MARRDLTGAVDFDHLKAYTGGDEAITAEVLDLFSEQAELWTRLLDPQGDPSAWRDGAHTLKGSALGLGATALGEACAAAEGAWQADPAVKAARLDEVRHGIDRVLGDIAAWRHERLLQELK